MSIIMRWSLMCIVVIITGICAEDGGVTNSTQMMLPMCGSCRCPKVNNINITEQFINATNPRSLQDASNVICLENNTLNQYTTYRLTGCPPEGYLDNTQGTDGICFEDTPTGSDLLLTPSKMVVGLHPFICWTNYDSVPPIYLYVYALAFNNQQADAYDGILFSDIQVYIDDAPLDGSIRDRPSVSIKEEKELFILVRVLAKSDFNVVIKLNATNPVLGINATNRFTTPGTKFLCSNVISNRGRYQLYSLQANRTDNHTTIRIFLEIIGVTNITIGEINITVLANPSTSTSTPGATSLPTEKVPETDDNSSITVILAVVIPLLFIILIVVVIIILLYLMHWHKSQTGRQIQSTPPLKLEGAEQTDFQKLPAGGVQNKGTLKVLVYSCDHHGIDKLLSKLREHGNFIVEELVVTPLHQLSDYIAQLNFELNQETVLLDCSYPGGVHDDLYKAVKYITQKPFGSPESENWKVFQLIYDKETRLPLSWSKPFNHVEMMHYSDFDDGVVNQVLTRLETCVLTSSRRTSSIDSDKSDIKLLKKDPELKEMIETIKAEGEKTREVLKGNRETEDKLESIHVDVRQLIVGQEAIIRDTVDPIDEEN